MINNINYYFRIWVRLTLSSFQTAFVSRFGATLFIIAKSLRFIFFLVMIVLVVTKTRTLAGYSLNQAIIFFLTFNIVDTVTQLLFREVYRFRPLIVSGDFDLTLVKPVNPLFTALMGGADPLDIFTLVPYLVLLVIFIGRTPLSGAGVTAYLILTLNAFMIATAFHILVLALGIITTEIDHTVMIYRDITSMARFPVDIYREPLRGFITFIIPVGVMMTFPPKALFGFLSGPLLGVALGIGTFLFYLSLRVWRYALTQYASASS